MRPWFLAVALGVLASATGVAILTHRAEPINAQPAPPTRFYGNLTIDGTPAPAGTNVTAVINGKDCMTNATQQIGLYTVDAPHTAQVAGCAQEGDWVLFRVGSRYAAQFDRFAAGTFKQLHLTVSGAGQAPTLPVGTGTATATASPSATATATPTPTPPPIETPPPFTQSALNFSGDLCIPAPDQGGCDDARAALWRGDQAAWTAWEQEQGRPAPDLIDIALLREQLRFEAGDPEARARFARFEKYPRVYITTIRYGGNEENEGDEYVEIANVGGGSQDMTGWRARAIESGVDMLFTEGTTLEAGARCRFYTGPAREDSCPGSIELSGQGIWPNDAGSAELWYDPLELLIDATRYSADPAGQPPAPALQGVR